MKKMLVALTLVSFAYFGAQAQQKCTCPPAKKIVHHETPAYPAKRNFAENFKVCQDAYGYHICGETPTCSNSTYCIPGVNKYPIAAQQDKNNYDHIATRTYTGNYPASTYDEHSVAATPHSQSYPSDAEVNELYAGNTYHRGRIIAADDPGRAPYEGEASPQDDGPEKNRQRNLNENSPAQNTSNPDLALPPASGQPAPGISK